MTEREGKTTSQFRVLLSICPMLGVLLVACLIAACGPATPTPVPLPTTTEPVAAVPDTPTPAPMLTATQLPATPIEPSPVPVETSVPLTTELKATVVAGLPPTPTPSAGGEADWGDVEVLPLQPAGDGRPLWAVFTVGMGFYDLEQGPFVAVYTYEDDAWQELGRVVLTSCAQYIDSSSLVQVQVEPSRIWLELESFTGAHSGCYDLLSFDGETLRHDVTHFNSSPGAGNVADLDGDGILEVVLNWTENYVFCYACSVRLPLLQVLRWDGEQLVKVELSPLSESAPADLRRLNDRAVELAQATLWKDAQTTISQALALDDQEPTVSWNAILIGEHAEALAEEVGYEIYPLLTNAFYGDYEAALDVVRPLSMEEVWEPFSPLVVDTPAEGWEAGLSDWISWTTGLALAVQPDPSGLAPSEQNLAAAYFLRGWGAHLRDPADPEALILVERAVELAPEDVLFSQSAAYLGGPAPEGPPTKPTSPPPEATPPPAEEIWEVRTLLAGPGEPGRLYVLLIKEPLDAWSAEMVRFLISDDYGQSWSPFPGRLPAVGCVHNVNMDYAAPTGVGGLDALYASTCQGLYRWSGSEWVVISPQETGVVAVVYGQPQVMWATETFESGGGVLRSNDGGVTWTLAGSGLISFNGVANIGIDPHDANTLYAIIWPKYGGSYLRRGTGDGQWQTMPTPLNNVQIDTGMTIDGATGALYVTAFSGGNWQLWRTLNPRAADVNDVHWELVHDFGRDVQVELLASGWSPEGLALYANLWPLDWKDESLAEVGDAVLHRSLDGGHTWTPLPIP